MCLQITHYNLWMILFERKLQGVTEQLKRTYSFVDRRMVYHKETYPHHFFVVTFSNTINIQCLNIQWLNNQTSKNNWQSGRVVKA